MKTITKILILFFLSAALFYDVEGVDMTENLKKRSSEGDIFRKQLREVIGQIYKEVREAVLGIRGSAQKKHGRSKSLYRTDESADSRKMTLAEHTKFYDKFTDILFDSLRDVLGSVTKNWEKQHGVQKTDRSLNSLYPADLPRMRAAIVRK